MVKAVAPAGSTRDKLIDAAFRVVARDGLEAASVKTIAAEAGVAPGLMHYHFASKNAVIEAALERSVAAFQARGEERRAQLPPGDQLAAFIADTRAAIEGERDFYKVRLALAARALVTPATAALLARQTAVAVAETAAVLAAAQGVAVTARHREIGRLLKAIFDGVMLAAIIDADFPVARAADLLEAAIATWLRTGDLPSRS